MTPKPAHRASSVDPSEGFRFLIACQYSKLTVFLAGFLGSRSLPEFEIFVEKLKCREFDSLVVDLFGLHDVDVAGAEALHGLLEEIKAAGIPTKLTTARIDVRDKLIDHGIAFGSQLEGDVTGAVRSLGFHRFDHRKDAPSYTMSSPQPAAPTNPRVSVVSSPEKSDTSRASDDSNGSDQAA